MRLLVLDNYDSFTWNLVQAFEVLGAAVDVRRNDALTVEEALALAPDALVVSPGPGRPEAAGITDALLRAAIGALPVLGVCLGHQAIAQVLGGRVGRARSLVHGKASAVQHDGRGLFADLPSPLPLGRYHSLAVTQLPACLEPCAWAPDGELMAFRHRSLPVHGVQFHPESVLSPLGPRLLARFLQLARRPPGA
jgi:anthranilate synthase/aminodeoxychorismate synthase-like glutamine amidotransferase